MRSYLDKSFMAVGFVVAVVVMGAISLACAGAAKVEKAPDKNALTAEQC
nr:hypothetical protein [Rubrobacteraceae bacterium]